MSARRVGPAVAVGIALSAALAGCSREPEPPEPPECVGEVVEGSENLSEMIPTNLPEGGRAVATEVDMAATPPTADLVVLGPSQDDQRFDASVGTTFEAEGTTYEVVRICGSWVDVVARQG